MARVERVELPAFAFEAHCSSIKLHPHGAVDGSRSRGLRRDRAVLSQLSYDSLVRPLGFEPRAFALRGRCSTLS
jgi:hypothetical protein